MLTVRVPLVRREDQRLAVRRGGHVLDLELARRDGAGFVAAAGAHRIQIGETVALPRKRDPVVRAPEDVVGGRDGPEHAAAALGRGEHGACGPILEAHGPDAPRKRLAHGEEGKGTLAVRHPHKSDFASVGGPGRTPIHVERGIQVPKIAGAELQHPDVRVVAPLAGPREMSAVRREPQFARAAAAPDQRLRGGGRIGGRASLDRATIDVDDPGSVGGQDRRVPGPEPARIAAICAHDPDLAFDRRRVAFGVRNLARAVRSASAHERDGRPVRRDRDAADLLPVVAGERGRGPTRPPRSLGDPDVARSALVANPGHDRGRRRGGQRGRERPAHEGLQVGLAGLGKPRGRCSGGDGHRSHERQKQNQNARGGRGRPAGARRKALRQRGTHGHGLALAKHVRPPAGRA